MLADVIESNLSQSVVWSMVFAHKAAFDVEGNIRFRVLISTFTINFKPIGEWL